MENNFVEIRNMVRRKTLLQIRKYIVLFVTLSIILIWINHCGDSANQLQNDKLKSFPLSQVDPEEGSPLDLNRTERLFQLTNKENIMGKLKNRKNRERITGKLSDELNGYFDKLLSGVKKTKNSIKPARYFVISHSCMMPYADPFSKAALHIYNPSKLKSCTNEPDLFRLEYDRNLQQYKFHVDMERKPTEAKVNCNYRDIVRGTNASADFYSELKPRVSFQHDIILDKNVTGIITECRDSRNTSHIIQQDAFPIIQVVKKTEEIRQDREIERQPSVILLGLDSMSRMNFQRTMPQTSHWVRQPGWFEMEGYNKVADNTLPNLLPVLCGHGEKQIGECALCKKGCLDELPWIWNDYKKAGYRTAFAEDIIEQALFNMGLPGFVNKPVDHYLRPFLLGISHALNVYNRFGYKYCIGRRLSIGYVYEFCRQFTQRYIEELNEPVFGFFWSATFTHDFYFGAASLDTKFLEYLKILESHKLFEKSIVILFSDHGARYGDLMELPDSFLEARLPMLHIYLPPWFRATYPKFSQHLDFNRNRLSSNYDLHNTLRHILTLNAVRPQDLPILETCPTSQSLFHALPRERTCSDACINEHWCTCNEYIRQALNGHIYQIGKRLIYRINYWMLTHRFNFNCQRLQLADIDHVERKVLFEDTVKETMYGPISIYRMRLHTFPPTGIFLTTLRYNNHRRDFDQLDVTEISRLNAYHNDSLCITNPIVKKFCFCYPDNLDKEMIKWRDLILNKQTTLVKKLATNSSL